MLIQRLVVFTHVGNFSYLRYTSRHHQKMAAGIFFTAAQAQRFEVTHYLHSVATHHLMVTLKSVS